MSVGDIVFKALEPSDPGYALPGTYDTSEDRLDYCHVGVVTSTAPFIITHCTSPGILRDTKIGKWKYRGRLKYIDYTQGDEATMSVPTNAVVTATSGSTVNLRAKASMSAAVLVKIPIGETVSVVNQTGDWCTVHYGSKTGFIKKEFLDMSDTANLEERLTALEARVSKLEEGWG